VQCSIVTYFCNIIMLCALLLFAVFYHTPLFPGTSSEPAAIPIMCDVPTTAVFCTESIQ
jgi:hypothetical protein